MTSQRPVVSEARSSRSCLTSNLAAPSLVLLLCLAAGSAPAAAADSPPDGQTDAALVGVTVVVENLAPDNGTWLTPFWVGFHDGTFDAFDTGSPAATALERLAEDGNAVPLSSLFASAAAGSVQGVMPADSGLPQIAPGETATRTFVLDSANPASRFVSWAAMLIPSNDAFVGTDDPQSQRIFDSSGSFLGAYVTIAGGDVLDAGTEVNDELPANTAFFGQTTPNTGVDEHGVVHPHPGYNPPGSGGILDDPMFADADFTTPGYQVARITIYRSDTIVTAGPVSGIWGVTGSPYILQGDVTVPAGATLTIEPGVVVYTEAGYGITVHGDLQAIGTAEQPILFTGSGWRGIRIDNATSTSRLEHCTIEHGDRQSTYESGGGIASIDSSLEIRHGTLRHNRAYLNGAAIYCSGGSLLVDDCEIFDNHIEGASSGEGGGISCESSDVEITRSRIHDNTVLTFTYFGATNSRGGGIALRDSGGLVARNVISGNDLNHSGTEAESAGGGIYVNGGAPVLHNNTIWGNRVRYNNHLGGGVYLRGYDARLINNIVAGNVGCGVWFDPGASTTNVAYNDVYGNSEGPFDGGYIPAGLGEITQTNHNGDPSDEAFNILLDPQLVAPATGDFRLMATSPCIDAGDPTAPPDPDGSIADIGALPALVSSIVFADGFEAGDTSAWSATVP